MARTKYNSLGGQSKAEEKYLEFMKDNCKETFDWQGKFILQQGFRYTRFNGKEKKHMAISFTPDLIFHKDKFCIDFKGGVIDNTYKIKCKLLTFIHKYDIIEIVEAPKWFSEATGIRYITFKLKEKLLKTKKELFPKVEGEKNVRYVPEVVKEILGTVGIKYNEKYLFGYSVDRSGNMEV